MISVSIIGSGKVALHLIQNLLDQEQLILQQIYARSPQQLPAHLPKNRIVDRIEDLKPADLFIIAVSDDAIAEVSAGIQLENQLIVHTSGSASIDAIQGTARSGVFYMLQTFSKDKEVDFSQIPFCLEAREEADFKLLETLALIFSEKVYRIDSTQRKSIHLAAVFVSNFTNHLYLLGEEVCKENQVPFEILKPLIYETAHKLKFLSPREAQTGPAIRQDQSTIHAHLEQLKDPIKHELYQKITASIQKK